MTDIQGSGGPAGAADVQLLPAINPGLPGLPAVTSSATADAMARLADWATSVTNVSRVVGPLIGTPFVPLIDSKGNKRDRDLVEAEAIGKVLYGLALGWDPLTSLQQIILIPGRAPAMYSKAKVAQLQSKGYRIRVVELTEDKCVMAGARPGADHEETVEVTMADAIRGEWGKTNENYKKNPKDMLHWRAAGRLCDQIGADALMGLATVEDVADLPPIQVEATTGTPVRVATSVTVTAADVVGAPDATVDNQAQPATTPPATAARNPQVSASPPVENPATPEDNPVDKPVDGPGPLPPHLAPATAEQTQQLMDFLRQLKRSTQPKAAAYIKGVVGREVAAPKDLTQAEAAQVLDMLEAELAGAEPWPDVARPADAQPQLDPGAPS